MDLRNQTQLYLGLWERETYFCLREALAGCSWCIDIGAGAGELSILFRKSGCPTVIAVDPQEAELDLLRANLGLNSLRISDVQVVHGFVGTADKAGYSRLDRLGVDPAQPGFIKIDVDGAELDVLASGTDLLNSATKLDLLLETHSKELETRCILFLAQAGFETMVIKNAWWRLFVPEARPLDHNRWLRATKSKLLR
jgi:hypothetical protein